MVLFRSFFPHHTLQQKGKYVCKTEIGFKVDWSRTLTRVTSHLLPSKSHRRGYYVSQGRDNTSEGRAAWVPIPAPPHQLGSRASPALTVLGGGMARGQLEATESPQMLQKPHPRCRRGAG